MSGLSEADALDAWRAAIAVQQRGWQLVPVEPTLGMMDALAAMVWPQEGICPKCQSPDVGRFNHARRFYQAALSVAPKAPTAGEGK